MRREAKCRAGETWIGVKHGWITGATRLDRDGDTVPGDAIDGFEDFEDRGTTPGAEIHGEIAATPRQMLVGEYMCPGEITDVDVVADAGAVGCVIIVTEYFERCGRRRPATPAE